jgi:phosphate acetyltransferase
MIEEYFPKALQRWNIPLLGLIPYLPYLSIPMMKDYEGLLKTSLISGEEFRLRHFRETTLVASSLESYIEQMKPNELVITPACREEIIQATIIHSIESGMILTDDTPPSKETVQLLQEAKIPALYSPHCSFEIMKMINTFCAKIQKEDLQKIHKAIELVEKDIDFDALCHQE